MVGWFILNRTWKSKTKIPGPTGEGGRAMTREEFLREVDEILELPGGTLQGTERLEDLNQWDSTTMLGFMALVDTHNGQRVSARQILDCLTVADLLSLAQVGSGSN